MLLLFVEAQAGPPGRGGGRGSLGGPSGSFGSANQTFGSSTHDGSPSSRWGASPRIQSRFGSQRDNTTLENGTHSSTGVERQRFNEEWNYNHRLEEAEHLRRIYGDNGNEQLSGTADRMEQSAQQHFTNRNQRMESFQNRQPVETGNLHTPNRAWNGPPTERMNPLISPPQSTPSSPGIEQQRLNEARNLNHRLNQAEHLRQLSESNGNSRLAETANRMQESAPQHFADRNQHIDSLQSRVAEQDGYQHMPQQRAATQNGYQHTPQNQIAEQNGYQRMPQQHVATPNGQQYTPQNRLSTQNGYQHTPQHPAVRQAQAIPPSPPSTAKKPSMLDRMRGLWPFK